MNQTKLNDFLSPKRRKQISEHSRVIYVETTCMSCGSEGFSASTDVGKGRVHEHVCQPTTFPEMKLTEPMPATESDCPRKQIGTVVIGTVGCPTSKVIPVFSDEKKRIQLDPPPHIIDPLERLWFRPSESENSVGEDVEPILIRPPLKRLSGS